MFSPEASIASARSSLRNPRRRPRPESESLRSRKRSKLNDATFKDPADAHINGNGSASTNGHAVQSVDHSVVVVDMPLSIREKKTAPKRAPKEDTGTYLVSRCASTRDGTANMRLQTKNANYSVKKLPGFPSALLRPSSTAYTSSPTAMRAC